MQLFTPAYPVDAELRSGAYVYHKKGNRGRAHVPGYKYKTHPRDTNARSRIKDGLCTYLNHTGRLPNSFRIACAGGLSTSLWTTKNLTLFDECRTLTPMHQARTISIISIITPISGATKGLRFSNIIIDVSKSGA